MFKLKTQVAFVAISLVVGVAIPSVSLATEACTIILEGGATGSVWLHAEPDPASEKIRELPLGDMVRYPGQDMAPIAGKDGWIWVKHDPTQEDIWQGGDPGWVPEVNLTLCG